MGKIFYRQDFRRAKTGGARGIWEDRTIRFEVDSKDESRTDLMKRALDELLSDPDNGFKSGWTSWKPRNGRFIDEPGEVTTAGHGITLEPQKPVEVIDAALLEEAEEAEESPPVDLEELAEVLPEPEESPPAGDWIGDAVERLKPFARHKIKNVYDRPEFPVDAVDIIEPDFEYADWKEERVAQLWKRRLG